MKKTKKPIVHTMPVGMHQTNCCLIEGEDKKLIALDPGDQASSILAFCKKGGYTICGILLTHGHFDHIIAMSTLKDEFNAPIYIHESDNELLLNPDMIGLGRLSQMRMAGYSPESADIFIKDGDLLSLGGLSFKVLHTPGHTKGSCCFALEKERILFSGDTLFAGSVGRADLYGGDEAALKASVKMLSLLQDDYTVIPGHGESTDLGTQKRTNPFMGSNYDDIF